jgi:AcrR family transcriptional regulator
MPPRRSTIVVTRRPGGRSARVVSCVLRATLEELGRVGYGRLRIDAVAARSGVNKTTIYRRWPEKAQLVCAALKTVGGPPGDPDTGSVRADLIESFRSSMRGWTTDRGRGLLRVLAVERADDAVDRIARALRGRHETARRAMLARAVARGELPASADVDLLLDVLAGAVLTRVRNHRGPLDPAWLARVVDFTLAAARATASASSHRPSSSVQHF